MWSRCWFHFRFKAAVLNSNCNWLQQSLQNEWIRSAVGTRHCWKTKEIKCAVHIRVEISNFLYKKWLLNWIIFGWRSFILGYGMWSKQWTTATSELLTTNAKEKCKSNLNIKEKCTPKSNNKCHQEGLLHSINGWLTPNVKTMAKTKTRCKHGEKYHTDQSRRRVKINVHRK